MIWQAESDQHFFDGAHDRPPAHRKLITINCGDCSHLSRWLFKSSRESNPRALSSEVFLFWNFGIPFKSHTSGAGVNKVRVFVRHTWTNRCMGIFGFLWRFLQTAHSFASALSPTPCSHGGFGQMFIQLRERKTWGRNKINIWDSKQKQNQKIVQALTLIFPSSMVWKKKKFNSQRG